MTMTLKVAGVEYENFQSATCNLRLDALANDFSFLAAEPGNQPLPFKTGDECIVLVDGEPVLTGFIEVIDVDFDATSHTVTISGRDKTADLLDSSLSNIDDIRGQELSLKQIIEKVIDHLGLDISVIDQVNPALFDGAEDIAAPEPGDNAFKFIEKYARKRQVLLTSNGDGNIVIAANSNQNEEGRIQHLISADDNNVISGRFSSDTTGRFNAYRISSGLNPVALNNAGDTSLESVVNQGNGALDNDIRASRQLVLISEAPFSSKNCLDRANWELNIRRARGLVYSATVPGYRVDGDEGNLWQINRLYSIVDDYLEKEEIMLSNTVTYSLNLGSGRTTSIGFVGKDAYSLLIQQSSIARVADNVI